MRRRSPWKQPWSSFHADKSRLWLPSDRQINHFSNQGNVGLVRTLTVQRITCRSFLFLSLGFFLVAVVVVVCCSSLSYLYLGWVSISIPLRLFPFVTVIIPESMFASRLAPTVTRQREMACCSCILSLVERFGKCRRYHLPRSGGMSISLFGALSGALRASFPSFVSGGKW